jgi:hypothetical protein
MTTVDTITKVLAFADSGGQEWWGAVYFNKGEVFAQDMHGGMRAPVDLPKLECGVSAKLLDKALKAVKGEPNFKQTKTALVITSGKSSAELPIIMDITQAPMLHRPGKTAWKKTAGLKDVSRVFWSCSEDPSRVNFNGVCLGESVIATNGNSLVALSSENFNKLLGQDVLVWPRMLKDVPEEAWIAVADGRLFISEDPEGQTYRTCALIDGAFPNVSEYLRIESLPACRARRQHLLDVVKRARISSQFDSLQFRSGRLSIEADSGRADSTLFAFMDSVELESGSGFKEVVLGLDLDLLLPAIQNTTSDVVTLRVSDPLSPLVVEDKDYLAVVMPYRL